MSIWAHMTHDELEKDVAVEGRRGMKRAPAASVFAIKGKPKLSIKGRPLDRKAVREQLNTAAAAADAEGNKRLAIRLQKKSLRWENCHRRTHVKDVRACIDLCDGEMEYQQQSCMVLGCSYCSKTQSAKLREHYEPAMLALWHKREHGEWNGRFWFYTPTVKLNEGETLAAAIEILRSSLDAHLRWICDEFGSGENGVIASQEIAPSGLQRGAATQVHAHVFIAINSNVQLSPKRLIVRGGIVERVREDFGGELNKRKIEHDWCNRIGRASPISRIYEIAPRGLPLELNRDDVRKRLESIGTESVEKMLHVNMRATITSAARELLKYVTKTAYLDASSLAEVIIALDGKRRIFSLGLFYGHRRKDLIASLPSDVTAGLKKVNRCTCPICGKKKVFRNSDDLPASVMAGVLRAYLERRGWLIGQAYGLILANKSERSPPERKYSLGPKELLHWLAELEGRLG